MHTHDELPVHPIDCRVGHHYTSTYPTIHFRKMLMVTRHLADRHVAVTHETVTVRRPGEATSTASCSTASWPTCSTSSPYRSPTTSGRPAGQGQRSALRGVRTRAISTTGQAPPIVVAMTVAVVPRSGWWLDQNETPASAPDMVIWGESAFSQKPRP